MIVKKEFSHQTQYAVIAVVNTHMCSLSVGRICAVEKKNKTFHFLLMTLAIKTIWVGSIYVSRRDPKYYKSSHFHFKLARIEY